MTDEIKDPTEFLEHYGVKGMRWGVRRKSTSSSDSNPRKSSGKTSKPTKQSNPNDPHGFLESPLESQSIQLQRKYGDPKGSFGNLTSEQKKKLALGAAGIAGIALAGAGVYYARNMGFDEQLKGFAEENLHAKQHILQAKKEQNMVEWWAQVTDKPIREVSVGLGHHWDEGIQLDAGSILQRLSTAKETSIRPNGFFAAFEKDDVERYKGVLPKYWEQWGFKEKSGYLTQLKAETGVKAPSGKESMKIFESLHRGDSPTFQFPEAITKMTSGAARSKAEEGYLRSAFTPFAQHWAQGLDSDPKVQTFFRAVKSNGFNALIDFNDSGIIAKTPLRVLDGAEYSISGNVPQSAAVLNKARKALTELEMSMLTTSDFLEHYGVKGMRWGVRRKSKSSSGSSSSSDPPKTKKRDDYQMLRRTALITAGGGVAALLVAKHANTVASPGFAKKEIAFDKHMHKAASLRKSLGSNKVPKAPKKTVKVDGDLAKMKAYAANAVKEANAQLRARDNDLGIPFPERSYLKEWG